LYYGSDKIEKNNFEQYIPLTDKSWLMDFLPYEEKYVKQYRDASTDKRLELLAKDKSNYFDNWFMYHAPFLKEYNL
jgi:hypothetical protein